MKPVHTRATMASHNPGSLVLLALSLLGALFASCSNASESAVGLIDKGQGPALVFIPGLNSGSETFSDTCEAFVSTHRCLLLTLPGFAGQPPMDVQQGFLAAARSEVIRLLRDHRIARATVVGHSLGGDLAMMIALRAPELVGKLVLIDSLPFYPAIQNPTLTVEMTKPQAARMHAQMNAQSDAAFMEIAAQSTAGMSNNPARHALLNQWTRTSDRATTTAAMIDMMVTDLRADIAGIRQPVLVLGAWAAYQQYGSTLESTKAIFATQYAALPGVDIRMSATGYHFLTWDDRDWVNLQIRNFLAEER